MNVRWRRWRREVVALRNRLLLLALVVALGAGFSLTLLQAASHLRASYDDMYHDNRLAHLTIRLDAPRVLDSDLEGLLEDHDADVRKAEARLVLDGNLDHGGDSFAARLIGVPGDWPEINDICVLEGDFDDGEYTCTPGDDHERRVADENVYLHAPFADANGVDERDTLKVTVSGTKLEMDLIGGALNTEFLVSTSHPEFLVPDTDSLAVIWVNQTWLQQETGLDGMTNEILVRFLDVDAEEQARDVLKAFLDDPQDWQDIGVVSMQVREDTFSYALAEGDVTGFFELSKVMAFIVAGITAATVAVTMRRIIESQGHLIGVVRSLGASPASIVVHYLGLAMVVGLAGALPGLLLGWYGAGALARWYQDILDFPTLHEQADAGLFFLAFTLAVLAALAGAFPAAWRAGRAPILSTLRPLEVHRPAPWLQNLTHRGSMVRRMTLRNLVRRPRRTLYTLGSLALAMVIALSMIGLIQSMERNIDDQFSDHENWDGIINLDAGTFRSDVEDDVEELAGVTDVEPFLSRFVTVDDEDFPVRVVGLQEESMHTFQVIAGDDAELDEERMALVTRPMVLLWKEETGETLGVGDKISLHHGAERLQVEIQAIVQEPVGAVVYLPIGDVQDLVAVGSRAEVDGYYLETIGNGPDDDAFEDLHGFVQYTTHDDLRDLMDEFTTEFREFASLFAVVGSLFGAAVIFNATTTNLDERKVEHATLRALGTSAVGLRTSLMLEAFLTALPAALLGVLLGLGATAYFTDLLSRELHASIVLDVPFATMLAVALGMTVVTVVGALLAARQLRRMDLAGLTKELAR